MDDMDKLHCIESTDVPEALQDKFREEGRQQVIDDPLAYDIDTNSCDGCESYSDGEYDKQRELSERIAKDEDVPEIIKLAIEVNYTRRRRKNVKKA
jgi:hypothetical protein